MMLSLSKVLLVSWLGLCSSFSISKLRSRDLKPPNGSKILKDRRERYAMMQNRAEDLEHRQQHGEGDLSNELNKVGKLEELKQLEAQLLATLEEIRLEKQSTIRSRPLKIGIVGFGRFGQFIARTFSKYGRIVVTSRSDYSEAASVMGINYVPWENPEEFIGLNLDVIVFAVSIPSFKSTLEYLLPYIKMDVLNRSANGSVSDPKGPLIVEVLSVKEHPKTLLLDSLPIECDVLCTHPMFGPDSGKDGWQNLNFVFEKVRINEVHPANVSMENNVIKTPAFIRSTDRMERYLSIWEEEGCNMVPMTCHEHDAYAANSQFITHLVGRVLGTRGLASTPIDTNGFKSILKLVDTTNADSFDLFYGLYKYNQKNSHLTIEQLQWAMDEVILKLRMKEEEELELQSRVEAMKLAQRKEAEFVNLAVHRLKQRMATARRNE